jgi:2-amino-4-hydroxy-6-hydroxymethyldihydropteridine diphosphokinase
VAAARELVYLALGSNLGDRATHLARARALLDALPDTDVVAVTAVEETEPIGPPQPSYLNQMILLSTGLPPRALLAECLAIENAAGRERARRCAIDEPDLTVPHPELAHREFWQREVAELDRLRR